MFPIPTSQFNGQKSKGNWQNLLQQEKVHQFFLLTQTHSRNPVGPIDPHHRRKFMHKGHDPLYCNPMCRGVYLRVALTHFQVEKENEKISNSNSWYDLKPFT